MEDLRADEWETAASEQVADCRVFKVRRDTNVRISDGKRSDFYIIDSPDWVNIVPLTSRNEIVMIEQYRPGTRSTILELPGGLVDEGEVAKTAAVRELTEETGYTSEKWVRIGMSHPNPAIQSNTIHYFLALDCERTMGPSFDPNESILTRLVPESHFEGLIADGQITHALIVAAFQYYRSYRSGPKQ